MNEKKTTKYMNKLKIQECQIFQVQPVFRECKITRAQVNNSSITHAASPKIHCLEMIYYKIPK